MAYSVDMSMVVEQLLVLFLTLGIGYAAMKFKAVTASFASGLSDFVLNITLPCLILSAALSSGTILTVPETLKIFGLNTLVYFFGCGIGVVTAFALRVPRADRSMTTYMMAFANVGFMGFPVIAAIFGADGLFFAVIGNIVFNLMNFTLGLFLIQRSTRSLPDKENPPRVPAEWRSLRDRFGWLLKPGVIASFLALILYFVKPDLPGVVTDTLEMVGQSTTPLAMILIGMSLSMIRFRDVFLDWRLYPFTLVKQLLLPLALLPVFMFFTNNTLLIGVLTVLAGMPVATTSVLFAESYNANLPLATKATFITTLSSMFTIPMLVWLLGNVV